MNYIVLYADDFDCDIWENYCGVCHVSKESKTITIWFDSNKVEAE